MSEPNLNHPENGTRSYYLIAPGGEHIVTQYVADSEDDAWRLVGRHFAVIPSERPARIVEMKAQGFTLSVCPPSNPTTDTWKQYNDLVTLRNALWEVMPQPGQPGYGDARWKTLDLGFIRLVDQNSRLRYWLEWVLTAESDELEQWRNGEAAAAIVNREKKGGAA